MESWLPTCDVLVSSLEDSFIANFTGGVISAARGWSPGRTPFSTDFGASFVSGLSLPDKNAALRVGGRLPAKHCFQPALKLPLVGLHLRGRRCCLNLLSWHVRWCCLNLFTLAARWSWPGCYFPTSEGTLAEASAGAGTGFSAGADIAVSSALSYTITCLLAETDIKYAGAAQVNYNGSPVVPPVCSTGTLKHVLMITRDILYRWLRHGVTEIQHQTIGILQKANGCAPSSSILNTDVQRARSELHADTANNRWS